MAFSYDENTGEDVSFSDWILEGKGRSAPGMVWDWIAGGGADDKREERELLSGVPSLPGDELRRRTGGLADTMEARIRGEGTSPAELQMRAGLDRQRAMAESLAQSGAGAYNPGLARRQALRAQGEAGAQFNADAGILRAQEQAAAEGRLATLLGQNTNAATDAYRIASDRYAAKKQREANSKAAVLDTAGTVLLPQLGHGGIVAEPTEAMLGEAGRPEAVIPLTSPADAALAATMIDRARMRMDAEQKARALAMLATRLTGGGKVHRAPAARLDDAAMRGGAMGALAARLTEGR